MTVLIISSAEDPASINMKNILLEQTTWREYGIFFDAPVYQHTKMNDIIIVTIPDKKIRHENIDNEVKEKLNIEPKLAIFLSRHRSKMEEPTLTVHPIGNFGDAEFGGKPKILIPSAPRFMTHFLRLIKKNIEGTNLKYQVCYEVTHHGPYLEVPTVFAEVGSTEVQWREKEPARIIAQSLLELLSKYHYEEDFPKDIPVLIGIGGGHYAPRFTDIVFEKNVAFGHMIPTYHIDAGNIDEKMIEKALQKTPNVEGAYINKKALKKSQVSEYKQWFESRGVPVVSSKDLQDL
jgi:D-aminoacyl-tRNA deacylase